MKKHHTARDAFDKHTFLIPRSCLLQLPQALLSVWFPAGQISYVLAYRLAFLSCTHAYNFISSSGWEFFLLTYSHCHDVFGSCVVKPALNLLCACLSLVVFVERKHQILRNCLCYSQDWRSSLFYASSASDFSFKQFPPQPC